MANSVNSDEIPVARLKSRKFSVVSVFAVRKSHESLDLTAPMSRRTGPSLFAMINIFLFYHRTSKLYDLDRFQQKLKRAVIRQSGCPYQTKPLRIWKVAITKRILRKLHAAPAKRSLIMVFNVLLILQRQKSQQQQQFFCSWWGKHQWYFADILYFV